MSILYYGPIHPDASAVRDQRALASLREHRWWLMHCEKADFSGAGLCHRRFAAGRGA